MSTRIWLRKSAPIQKDLAPESLSSFNPPISYTSITSGPTVPRLPVLVRVGAHIGGFDTGSVAAFVNPVTMDATGLTPVYKDGPQPVDPPQLRVCAYCLERPFGAELEDELSQTLVWGGYLAPPASGAGEPLRSWLRRG